MNCGDGKCCGTKDGFSLTFSKSHVSSKPGIERSLKAISSFFYLLLYYCKYHTNTCRHPFSRCCERYQSDLSDVGHLHIPRSDAVARRLAPRRVQRVVHALPHRGVHAPVHGVQVASLGAGVTEGRDGNVQHAVVVMLPRLGVAGLHL
jgi:hypothetical protein